MAGDAAVIAPHFYKVVLENDRVRVLEFLGRPGDKTEMHSHPALVYIGLTDGSIRFSSSDEQTLEKDLTAGQVMYLDPVDHSAEVLGSGDLHGFIVELK